MAFPTAAAAAALARPSSVVMVTRPSVRWIFKPLAISSFSSPSSPSTPSRRLVLYSKPGCCLCDGLKDKLQAAFLLSGPDSLHDIDLQIRDITSDPEWERAYQYEIPVLAKLRSDGTEWYLRASNIYSSLYIDLTAAGKSIVVIAWHYDYFELSGEGKEGREGLMALGSGSNDFRVMIMNLPVLIFPIHIEF